MEVCNEAKYYLEKGNINIKDTIEFKTIRDVTDLFHKNYEGYMRSWINVSEDWSIVASCYHYQAQIYDNFYNIGDDCFYYKIRNENDTKKKEFLEDFIYRNNMKTTYLFYKFQNSKTYKFIGVFEKDIDEMKRYMEIGEYRIIYKKVRDELKLN